MSTEGLRHQKGSGPGPSRALVCCYGTRGDVEPFLALAKGLQSAGVDVLLATSSRFREFIDAFGVDFFPMSDESLSIMDTPDGKAMIEGTGGLMKRMFAGTRLAKTARAINKTLLRQTWEAADAFAPDLIVFSVKLFGAAHVAEKRGVPAVLGALQPMIVPTRAFPAFGLPDLPVPGYNRLSYALVRAGMSAFRKDINQYRSDLLNLPPVRSGREVLLPHGAGDIPVLNAVSPALFPHPADWPASAYLTGFWRLDKGTGYTPPPKLSAFLENGPPPVFVGFGSMTSADPKTLGQLVTGALRKAGQRGVVAKGWAELDVDHGDDVIAIPPAPYDWLFPRMAAVVHHGGAGTTSEGFHAGVPCVICPFFGDQPGWAKLSVALGVGTEPIPRKRMTEDRLAAAIAEAATCERLQKNASTLAARLADEDGVKTAVEIILERLGESRDNAPPQ